MWRNFNLHFYDGAWQMVVVEDFAFVVVVVVAGAAAVAAAAVVQGQDYGVALEVA